MTISSLLEIPVYGMLGNALRMLINVCYSPAVKPVLRKQTDRGQRFSQCDQTESR
jgi:hypothetical protein